MATVLDDISYLASYPPFVGRVRAAMVQAAVSIGEETADVTTDYRRLRRALSVNALQDADTWSARFSIAVAAQSAITKDSADTDISTAVAAVWDSIAGAGPAPA